MTDFGAALALAKSKVAENAGYRGYRGYASGSARRNNELAGANLVTPIIEPEVTEVTATHPGGFVVTPVTPTQGAEVTAIGQEYISQFSRLLSIVTPVTPVTPKNSMSVNFSGQTGHHDAIRRAALRNSLELYEPQASPHWCHVCGKRESTEAVLVPVLTPVPGAHHWLHLECHEEHMRRIAQRRRNALGDE